MAESKDRTTPRTDRELPGVWRLRLPLPWPGVPHGNAWAVAAGSGVVLFDTGMGGPGGLAQLERALYQAGLKLEHVRLLVCTQAHSDHYGLAGPIIDATGCELWMHPNHKHMTQAAEDPDAALNRRIEVARSAGVPSAALERYHFQPGFRQFLRQDAAGPAETHDHDIDVVELRCHVVLPQLMSAMLTGSLGNGLFLNFSMFSRHP